MNPALVLGGAACVWEDLAALEEMLGQRWPWRVYAINDAGYAFPRNIDAWVSLHPEKMPDWMEIRRERGFDMDFVVWGGIWRTGRDDRIHTWVDRVLRVPTMTTNDDLDRVGSSGMHAVDVARHDAPDELVVACGVPIDARPHFFSRGSWESPLAHRDAWEDAKPEYLGRVFSMSGWTRELLGAPDPSVFEAVRPS